MRDKNLRHELIPAEKRLARIDAIDRELERRRAANEIDLVEYVAIKQPLTVKRFKEFRLVERAMGWNHYENIDVPEKVPIVVEPEPTPEPEPVAIGQRLLGLTVVVVLVVVISWVWCWLSKP
jgi:hypothetical protein